MLYARWLLYAFVVLSVLLALTCGSLTPTLVAFDSMQLIAYLPLILTNMPTTTNIFILESLSVFRLHLNSDAKQYLSQWIGDDWRHFGEQ